MHLPLADGFMSISPTQIAVLVTVAAIIFSVRRWRINAIKKRNAIVGTRERFSASAAASSASPTPSPLNVRDVTTQIHALLTDLEETARRVAAQVDNRRVRLEQLLEEADKKIKQIEALRSAPAAPLPAPSPPTAPVTFPAPPAAGRDATQMLNRLRQERGAPPAKEDPAYQPIYQLADQGKNAREIAQTLGRQPGEVELILALRGRQRA